MNVLEYKSNVFALLMEEPKYAAEVYNLLNGTSYGAEMIEIKKHNSGVVLSVRNDASFLVDSYLNLYEHQSTYCPNMPLRFMIYFSAIMQDIISEKDYDLFGRKIIPIPTPKFVVFYNGVEKRPEREVMKLSDVFSKKEESYQLDLSCEVYNISRGSNESVVNSSSALYGYMTFVEMVRAYIDEKVEIGKAVSMSVENCIKRDILTDFFRNRRKEIEEVAALDFSFEKRSELIRRDSYEDGVADGIERGIEEKEVDLVVKKVKKGMNPAEIAEALEEPEEEIRRIYEVVIENAPEYDIKKIMEKLKG